MTKRTLLAVSIAALGAASVQAAPFLPMDARGLAMGNTGVASAKRAHAPAYNPSLLSQAEYDDDFAIILPQAGVTIADDDEVIDTFTDLNEDLVPMFQDMFDDANTGNLNSSLDAVNSAADTLSAAMPSDISAINGVDEKIAEVRTANNNLKDALSDLDNQLASLDGINTELTQALNDVSGSQLRARLGVSTAIAFPGKEFAAALSVSGEASFSGRALFSSDDATLINAYSTAGQGMTDAAQNLTDTINSGLDKAESDSLTQEDLDAANSEVDDVQNYTSDTVHTAAGDINIIEGGQLSSAAEDAEMNSYVQVVGVAVTNIGISFSREFTIADQKVAIGITPKLQRVMTLHYVAEADYEDGIDEDQLRDDSETFNQFNMDVGASYRFGSTNKWVAGVVVKNLLGGEFETRQTVIHGSATNEMVDGPVINLDPQFRAGVAFNGDWTTVALDVDLMENKPVAFEQPTQVVNLGTEFDIFETVQFRAGYRTNLSTSQSDVMSLGFGFSPWGVHIDIAALANPDRVEKEAGVALETGFYF